MGIRISLVIIVFLATAMSHARSREDTAAQGLMVGADGTLLLEGKPFMGFGMQYHDCFRRRLLDPEDTTYRAGFEELASYDIPFVRFMACGFWPAEMQRYLKAPEAYFELMDDVVATAERVGMGLIPSLFWWSPCVPDIVGEPINQWGNPDSKTHAFMREYTRRTVTRYRSSPAVWAWEFGNEYNLAIDKPNAMDTLPWVVPERGTPATRGAADVLCFEDLDIALRAFADEARKHDPHRVLSTGHAIPRPSACHLRLEGTWARDTREQYIQALRDQNPDPYAFIGLHLYPAALEERYFGRDEISFDDLLVPAMEAARRAGKVVFVGEFGAHDDERATRAQARRHNESLIQALLRNKVPIASYWVYDYARQDAAINVTSSNHRSYVLDLLRDANHILRQRLTPPARDGE